MESELMRVISTMVFEPNAKMGALCSIPGRTKVHQWGNVHIGSDGYHNPVNLLREGEVRATDAVTEYEMALWFFVIMAEAFFQHWSSNIVGKTVAWSICLN